LAEQLLNDGFDLQIKHTINCCIWM